MPGREGREVLWFLLLCRACGNVPSIRSQEMERYRCFKGDTLEDLSCSLAGRIQKCYSNCYFSPFNVEILKMLTFQWTATVFFDHLNGILQNQTQSVAVMSVSTSECPDDPEGKLWQSIAMEVSIAMEPKNAGWFISWKIPSRNG